MIISKENSSHENFDLCIIGAGAAGLNALFAATEYLKPEQRVALVDIRSSCGGMWHETYDYVRLHQPYQTFTAGNMAWSLNQKPSYLAGKNEVIDHLQICFNSLGRKVTLIEYWCFQYIDHQEISKNDFDQVEIQLKSIASGAQLKIKSKKLIKAFGLNVPQAPPLQLTSKNIESLSPHDQQLFSSKMQKSKAPVYIIGGGKTGMDTAQILLSKYPERKISAIVGNGTVFMNRNRFFPTGLKRWFGGHTTISALMDVAMRFDGTNEAEIHDYYRKEYSVNLNEKFQQFSFGIMSEEENSFLKSGIAEILTEYLSDIVDTNGQTMMIFKSGKTKIIEAGSTIVNCTGYLLRQKHDYEPYVSESGNVVSIQPTSGTFILSTFSSYFLAHLLYCNKIKELPLYEVDHKALLDHNRTAYPFVCMTQFLLNFILIMDSTPISVSAKCGLNYDLWYPFYRRLMDIIKIKLRKNELLAHYRKTLDCIQQRHNFHCGVLNSVAQRSDK